MLELDDIQSGVLRPRPSPYVATYILLRIDDRRAGRELMGRLGSVVTAAAHPRSPAADSWVSVALTYHGLEALGVPRDSLDSFAWEFRQGMVARAKALGDGGESSPEHWETPLGTSDVHIVLTALSPDRVRLEAALERAHTALRELGGIEAIWRQDCHALSTGREPFGFKDGISHPAVEGSGIPGSNPHEEPLRAGEFVLGYPDETGGLPPMPRPDVLGRNGTYVVFRKLHQRVAAFRQYLKHTARNPEDEECLAAKMMGRWRSGAPLALCPHADAPDLGADASRNNDFVYSDDPTGYKTPPASHVRRANPRDASVAGVVRLHRMIRRGTAYGPELPEGVLEDDGAERGLMFAFIGAHLGRQFEFVQSEWINGGGFLGLGDAKDPLAGANDGTGVFSFPKRPIPRRLQGLPRFVVTRGGEYCFMPGLRALRWLADLPDMNGPASMDMDVVVIGAGPAGLLAALRAGDLGARTALVARDAFGGMAANDGPVPVRTLAQAARLLRDARQLGRYGIAVTEPVLDYARLLTRVREVTGDVRARAALGEQLAAAGVTVHEHAGAARFMDPHTVETWRGPRFRAEKFILCSGGVSRRLPVPGFELTATHSDAWSLTRVPPTMLVVGGGATGVQVASVFTAFGTRVQLFQSAARILTTEDADVSAAVAESFRRAGMVVREAFGEIERFERTPGGVRMVFSRNGVRDSAEAALVVVAVGWTADTSALNLAAAGVETDSRGFVRVDAQLRTSAPHIFAAGDVTGRLMLVPQALQDGFVAGTNAARAPMIAVTDEVSPIGSFTDPEYAQAGLTEAKARQAHDVVVAVVRFDSTTRTIIDGRTDGFCKLIVDRATRRILGCHVVGERAVDLVQTAAIAIAAGMRVDELARVPLSFPTYTGVLGRAAAIAARQLQLDVDRARFAELL